MMQFLLVLALLALLAPAMAFRATPRFLASQSMLSPTQFIVNKNTMLFADEQEPSNAPDTPATEKNLKVQFDGALFNKGTFIFSFSMFFFLFSIGYIHSSEKIDSQKIGILLDQFKKRRC